MKKLLLAGMLALGWAGSAQAVTTVTFNGGSGTLPGDVTVYQNFDALAPGTVLGPNAGVRSGTSGLGARPAFGSTGNFASVTTGGSFTTMFGAANVFSFVLGSLDTYNTLTLLYANGTSQDYIGGQIINDLTFPSGNQISGETNGVITYRVTSGPALIGARFTTSDNSFEFDNLASTAVPEAATWAMMILGFGLMGAAVRRQRKVAVTYA